MDLDLILKVLTLLIIPAGIGCYKWIRSVEATIVANKTSVEKVIDANKAEADKVMEKHRTDNTLTFQEHHLRLEAAEKLIQYLVGAGKDLKDQQNAMAMSINSVNLAITEINKNVEKIIIKLDKQDEAMNHFYRELDKHKAS